jgi:periplasmic divalent cation tolerance protein
MPYRLVLSTINDRSLAERLATTLLQDCLVACVNILGPLVSLYRWEGKIERDEEYLLVMKTMANREAALMARVQELHPYEVPELLCISIESGASAYLQWLSAAVQ